MRPNKFTLENVKKGVKDPTLLYSEIRSSLVDSFYTTNSMIFNYKYGTGIDVVDQDWDNLIILDACRYDYFEQCNHIRGDLSSVVSKGSESKQFIRENFVGKDLHDTVYVTANPYGVKIPTDEFYTIESLLSEWDTEIETVMPDVVKKNAIDAHQRYPHKRLIVHFMQPHMPHIGEMAAEIRNRVNISGWSGGVSPLDSNKSGKPIWEYVRENTVSHGELRKAYRQSLEIVLDHAEELVDKIEGKTIITADHGDMLGERVLSISSRKYSHPSINTPELRIVPWLVIDSQNRRHIEKESPIGYEQESDDVIQKRLAALGYTPN